MTKIPNSLKKYYCTFGQLYSNTILVIVSSLFKNTVNCNP